jgi:diguanylate cyclase (GGDEF)-like protein/PAS domain S-box-containing protein
VQATRWTFRLAWAITLLAAGAAALWLHRTDSADSSIVLTATERAYLARHAPIRFISQRNYPPFEFVDANGERRGMMIELVRWIATEAGFHVEFADAEFRQAQDAVSAGKADVLTSLFFSEARDRDFDFSTTVFEVPASMFVRKARTDIATLDDLAGKRIAIQRGDFAEQFLRSAGLGFEQLPTTDFAEATQAVIDGDADMLIGDEQIVFHHLFSKQLDDRLKVVGDPLYVGRNAMAVREGERVLLGVIDKGIEHARQSGTLRRLERKWLGADLPQRVPDWRVYGPYALGALLLILAVAAWNLRLEQLVRRKTAALEAQEQRLREVIDGTRAATWIFHLQDHTLEINEYWAEMLGYRLDELGPTTYETFRTRVHPADEPRARAQIERHLAGEIDHYSCELRMQHRDGHWIWMLDRGRVTVRAADGTPRVMSGTHIDISASKEAEERLQLAASAFRNAHEGVVITDTQGCILDINEAFTRITGYTAEEAIGRNPRMLKSGRQDADFYTRMWRALTEQGLWEGEIWNRRKSGEIYPETLTVSAVRDKHGKTSHYVAVFSDVSRHKEHEAQLQRMAYFDGLTGLANRALLNDRLVQAMMHARRSGAVVMLGYIDLDGFKQINDCHGHACGDRVLVTIARRLTQTLRQEDTVARVGGDEFIFILREERGVDDALPVIERLLARIAEPIVLDALELRVSGSIGISSCTGAEDIDAEQLVRQADQAMYRAKQTGKNRYHVFDTALDRAERGRHEHIERIRKAIREDELTLHYQPKVDMATGAVHGVEALLRWQHPERGLLAPRTFLPALANDPVTIELGRWVLATALAQCAAWKRAQLSLRVSVNIDTLHLQHEHFTAELARELERHPDVSASALELEVLETSALGDLPRVSRTMNACRSLGVDFALDDFGTGYSSLAYLRHLPAGVLKIDQSFVRNMLDDPEDLTIVEGILGLAKGFRRTVIAEGVETLAQGCALLALGCRLGQGYAIAHPMDAAEIACWVRDWTPPRAWTHCVRGEWPPDGPLASTSSPGSSARPRRQDGGCGAGSVKMR